MITLLPTKCPSQGAPNSQLKFIPALHVFLQHSTGNKCGSSSGTTTYINHTFVLYLYFCIILFYED